MLDFIDYKEDMEISEPCIIRGMPNEIYHKTPGLSNSGLKTLIDCPAKYYCSGGCCANNIHFCGDISTPYSISCEMMKKRFELSLAISAIEATGTK